jgi:hypothetical protein
MSFFSNNAGYIGSSQQKRSNNIDVVGKANFGVVSSGLVLHLDAGNTASYPGTGTTWTDLSGSANHGTLVNGVTWSGTTDGGVMICTATSSTVGQYIRTSGPNLSTTNHTIMAGTKIFNTAIQGRVVSGRYTNFLLGYHGGGYGRYYSEGWINDLSAGLGTNITYKDNDTNWRIFTCTGNYTSDSWALYDGLALSFGPNSYGSQGPNAFYLGTFNATSEFSNCYISFVLAYNRVLSYAEIMQNYYVFKNRYPSLYTTDYRV